MDEKEKDGEENLNIEAENSVSSEEREEKQSYYYDDSTGYEIYTPDENDVEDEE